MMSARTLLKNQITALTRTHHWPVILIILIPIVLVGAYKGGRIVLGAYIDHAIDKNRGQTLPPFSLFARDGRTFSLDDLNGKIVVLNFMRSFCSGCKAELPAIRALAREVDQEEIIVVSVIVDEVMGFSPEDTSDTLARAKFDHPILIADKHFVDAFHGVGWAKVTPVTYIADASGKIVHTLRGPQTLNRLRRAIEITRGGR